MSNIKNTFFIQSLSFRIRMSFHYIFQREKCYHCWYFVALSHILVSQLCFTKVESLEILLFSMEMQDLLFSFHLDVADPSDQKHLS